MPRDIKELLNQIQILEEELEQRIQDIRNQFSYSLKGHRVRFENEARKLHRSYRTGLLRYLRHARPLNVLTAPVIYGMIFPILIIDLSITTYQHICFRAYGIPRVRRRDYLVIDRHQLAYLNLIEKFNCIYCGYGNGVLAYVREIVARTEQYWCPIKHAQRVHDAHDRYTEFFDYGDPDGYKQGLKHMRKQIKDDQVVRRR